MPRNRRRKAAPLPLNHPEIIQLMVDAERERIDWRHAGRGAAYQHDDTGRVDPSVVGRLREAGYVKLTPGRAPTRGTVEPTMTGLLYLQENGALRRTALVP